MGGGRAKDRQRQEREGKLQYRSCLALMECTSASFKV